MTDFDENIDLLISELKYNFDVIKTLGSGAFGKVLLCREIETEKQCAIKCLKVQSDNKREYLQKLINEAELHSKLNHPQIIKLYNYKIKPDFVNIILEYADGGDLKEYLNDFYLSPSDDCSRRPLFSDFQASQLIKTILMGLKYIHESNVVHRDLKPENILFLRKNDLNSVKIADFGLSAEFRDHEEKTLAKVCGTLSYMAPEIFKGHSYTKKVDIYSLGIILWHCMIGKFPVSVRESNKKDVINFALSPNWIFPENTFSEQAQDFFLKLVNPDPKDRYDAQTALNHPWITRRFDEQVPMTLMEIQSAFYCQQDLKQNLKMLIFLNYVKVNNHQNEYKSQGKNETNIAEEFQSKKLKRCISNEFLNKKIYRKQLDFGLFFSDPINLSTKKENPSQNNQLPKYISARKSFNSNKLSKNKGDYLKLDKISIMEKSQIGVKKTRIESTSNKAEFRRSVFDNTSNTPVKCFSTFANIIKQDMNSKKLNCLTTNKCDSSEALTCESQIMSIKRHSDNAVNFDSASKKPSLELKLFKISPMKNFDINVEKNVNVKDL